MSKCALYRHFDVDGALLYVGISLSAIGRLSAHAKSSWADDIARVGVEKFASRKEAENAERLAIQSEKPLYNLMHAAIGEDTDAPVTTPAGFRGAAARLGLSRGEMAKALGVSPTTVSNWSWGHASIPPFMGLALKWLEHEAQKDG